MIRRRFVACGIGVVLASSACGNLNEDYPFVGLTGAQVDSAGHVSITVLTCSVAMTRVVVAADRTGLSQTQENPMLATYRTSRPSTELSLDLADPGSSWTPTTTFAFPADRGVIVTAEGDDDTEAAQIFLSRRGVRSMRPGGVYVNDEATADSLQQLSRQAFVQETRKACER